MHAKPGAKLQRSLTCLQKNVNFAEFLSFEAYHISRKLELTKENEYDFRNQRHKITETKPLPCRP